MRLTDADILYKQVEEREEKARERVLDTGSSLPYPSYINPSYTRYSAQLEERTRLKHMIADAPTIELPHWIPCSERLPEEDGEYLCDYNGHLHIGQVINKHFRHYGEIADHLIIAWMPLPEPYGGEKNETD